jgi:hypothetical protein
MGCVASPNKLKQGSGSTVANGGREAKPPGNFEICGLILFDYLMII